MRRHHVLIAVLSVGIAAAVAALVVVVDRSPQQQAAALKPTIEQQRVCGQHAAQLFKDYGYDENSTPYKQTYNSYYNAPLSKCFIFMDVYFVSSASALVPSHTMYLFDAIGRRIYAEYFWVPLGTQKAELNPVQCVLHPTSTADEPCKSEEEFKAFVAKYMD